MARTAASARPLTDHTEIRRLARLASGWKQIDGKTRFAIASWLTIEFKPRSRKEPQSGVIGYPTIDPK